PPGAAPPSQTQTNPICVRLEGQLAAVDRGGSGGDPAREEQIRRYQDAQTKQQAELDRVTMQAKRMGCESSGFFSLFNGQSAQCGPVNNQIQQMRGNLDQITTSLERLRSGGIGGNERENQRRSVLTALAQNNCGPQYANAARGGGNFIDNLFGNNNPGVPSAADLGPQSGTFRTVCVRTCDGAYFPVSFATYPARFPDDEKTCKALCPQAPRQQHRPRPRLTHRRRRPTQPPRPVRRNRSARSGRPSSRRSNSEGHPSKASTDARPARAISFSSGSGNAVPLSRKRL